MLQGCSGTSPLQGLGKRSSGFFIIFQPTLGHDKTHSYPDYSSILFQCKHNPLWFPCSFRKSHWPGLTQTTQGFLSNHHIILALQRKIKLSNFVRKWTSVHQALAQSSNLTQCISSTLTCLQTSYIFSQTKLKIWECVHSE